MARIFYLYNHLRFERDDQEIIVGPAGFEPATKGL